MSENIFKVDKVYVMYTASGLEYFVGGSNCGHVGNVTVPLNSQSRLTGSVLVELGWEQLWIQKADIVSRHPPVTLRGHVLNYT